MDLDKAGVWGAWSDFFSLLFSTTAAEIYRKGRRVETEVALTGEGGTQLAAARDRCSS
jgi:hypothetical protein